MKTKHTNYYVYILLQVHKIRSDKKTEVKWTEKVKEEIVNWKSNNTPPVRQRKTINFKYKFLMCIIL